MAKKHSQSVIPVEQIEKSILLIRGEKVMLDFDLADLYGVETRVLVQAVKRNIDLFPPDFMFQLSRQDLENWRSQIVISKPSAKMGLRRRPYGANEKRRTNGDCACPCQCIGARMPDVPQLWQNDSIEALLRE